ncbi:MAG TPA: DinB family protein [Propionibacteriaceae bacterium]
MPGMPPSVKTEREALVAYLTQQRDGLKYAAYGLTPEQLRSAPTRSTLTVGGLLKHGAATERDWWLILSGQPAEAGDQAYADSFTLTADDTVEDLIAAIDAVAAETEGLIRDPAILDKTFQLPDAPWYPKDSEGFTGRWIVLHIIEELARHAGHADIIREQIDGATMYELMAGVEGWPESEWIKPWRPA